MSFGSLRIEASSREVTAIRLRIDSTAIEFDLLRFLATHPRYVFTRRQLLETVWHSADWLGEATVTDHVHRLRNKLGTELGPAFIRTGRGVGYQFDVSPSKARECARN
jgi:DNA-binding response OmpR family regulator